MTSAKTTVCKSSPTHLRLESRLSAAERQKLSSEALKALPELRRLADPRAQNQALLNYAMERTLEDYLAQHPQPLRQPPAFRHQILPSGELGFSAELDLYPEVSLPAGYALSVEAPALTAPGEAELRIALEALQLNHARFESVARPAAAGDLVLVDYHISCDGRILPQSAHKDQVLSLPQPGQNPEPAWLGGLVGLEAGERRELAFTLPADFPHPAWRSQPAICHLRLKLVTAVQVARLDDALAQQLGYASLDQLLATLAQELSSQRQTSWQQAVKDRIVAAYADQAQVEIDPAWIRQELRAAFAASDEPALDPQLPAAQREQLARDWQELPYLRQQKHALLKNLLVLRALIAKEGLQVNENEMDQALTSLSASSGEPVIELRQRLVETRQILLLAERLLMEKAVSFLFARSRVMHQGQELIAPQV